MTHGTVTKRDFADFLGYSIALKNVIGVGPLKTVTVGYGPIANTLGFDLLLDSGHTVTVDLGDKTSDAARAYHAEVAALLPLH